LSKLRIKKKAKDYDLGEKGGKVREPRVLRAERPYWKKKRSQGGDVQMTTWGTN